MKIEEYKIGDPVEVLTSNPGKDITGIQRFWHKAVVTDIQTIYPSTGGKHQPYPILIVKFTRTYVDAKPTYRTLENGVKVFVDNDLTCYDKPSYEGFIYHENVKPQTL